MVLDLDVFILGPVREISHLSMMVVSEILGWFFALFYL